MKTLHLRKNNQMTLLKENEAWIYQDPKLIASIRRGLTQAAEGKLKYLGDFRKAIASLQPRIDQP